MSVISPAEYLAGERISDVKHELIDGQVHAMAGASINHQRICANVAREFGNHLRGSNCEAVSADILVNVGDDLYTQVTSECRICILKLLGYISRCDGGL